jgi:NADH:ubiquinone oxidoreductase subunit F (NADH-binding)
MRAFLLVSAVAAVALFSLSAKFDSVNAIGKSLSVTAASIASQSSDHLRFLRSSGARLFAANSCHACGLCTDVDCCGGTAQGWKLCSCGDGTYKCCQNVAQCP